MIHAFNFSCNRDWDLSELMLKTLNKYCPVEIKINVVNTDTDHRYSRYVNGAGWEAGMMKVDYMKTMSFADDDWVLSVDSDVVFGNSMVFNAVQWLPPLVGIAGIVGEQPWGTFYGKWPHMSGCLIFMRGSLVKAIRGITPDKFDEIRQQHFKAYNITENEDVMLSYFARMFESPAANISNYSSSDFEQDIMNNFRVGSVSVGQPLGPEKHSLKSFYHLNYCPTQFMGYPVTGKWDIPSVLKKTGLYDKI